VPPEKNRNMNYKYKEVIQQADNKLNIVNEINNKEVKIIDVNNLMPYGAETAIFNGFENNANVSFFIVCFSPGNGSRKHRHPYEETFIILEGAIEAVIDGKTYTIPAGNILVVPPDTWHEFSNKTDKQVLTVNIHPAAKMITEWFID
jgi:quercetin dioxygenase-like cupin family protein